MGLVSVLEPVRKGSGFVCRVNLVNDDKLGKGFELVQVAVNAHEDDGSDSGRLDRFVNRTFILKRATLELFAYLPF